MSELHTLTIAGQSFTVAPRYAEGHVLTANEASTLNQTFYENLRNNFAGKAKEGGTQADFDAYVDTYKFGERTGGGGGSRDPVEVEAMDLARDAVKKAIQAKGGKIADYKAAAISEAAKKLVETNPVFREKAKERVEQMRAVASDTVADDILASLSAPAAEADPNAPEGDGGEATEDEPAAEQAAAGRSRKRS